MSAVAAKMAFVEDEAVDRLRRRREARMGLEPVAGVDGRLAPPRERDVGQEGSPVGRKARADKDPIDFLVELRQRIAGNGAGEQGAARALIEETNALQSEFQPRNSNQAQRGGYVFGEGPLDLADESQGHVKMFFALPCPAGRAAGNRIQAVTADRGGWPKCDE